MGGLLAGKANFVDDRTRGFSKDQLNRKQLSLTFQPDALVVFRAKVKLDAKIALLKGCTVL